MGMAFGGSVVSLTIDVNHKTSWWFSNIFRCLLYVHREHWGMIFSHFDGCICFQGVGEKTTNQKSSIRLVQGSIHALHPGISKPKVIEMGVEPKNRDTPKWMVCNGTPL